MFITAVLSVLYFVSANSTRAAVSACESRGDWPDGVEMERVVYLGPFNSTATDSRASGSNHVVTLRGWLYYKRSAAGTVKNSKVLVFNHGFEQERPEPCSLVTYFINNGYVVFAPLRRGHVAKAPDPVPAGWRSLMSTGIHITPYKSKCVRSQEQANSSDLPHLFCNSVFCRQDVPCGATYKDNAVETDYLSKQRDDIREQFRYIIERGAIGTEGKLADPERIALLGHSYGGSASIFANQLDLGQNVTIAVSAAEKSWNEDNPYWEIDLSAAMLDQKRPMYFLGPKNGRSLEPIGTLFRLAVFKEYRSQAAIFAKAPWDPVCADEDPSCWDEDKDELKPEWEQAHSTFFGQRVDAWGSSVRNFIVRNPR